MKDLHPDVEMIIERVRESPLTNTKAEQLQALIALVGVEMYCDDGLDYFLCALDELTNLAYKTESEKP